MNKREGISLIVLIITIIIIVILAGTVILNLADNNPILQATKASFLNDVKTLQTELELSLSKQYLDSLGSYDITLLQANETSIKYKDVEDNTKNIYDLIPSLKSNLQYSGQVEIIDGKLTYKGTDINKQEWAKEVGIVLPLDIAAGYGNISAIMFDGTVKIWGYNKYGCIGNGTTKDSYVPLIIPGLTGVKQIAISTYNTLALLNDGTVKAWGYNNYGQFGDGTTNSSYTPIVIPELIDVKQIAVGNVHSVALLNDGTVKVWGYNGYGNFGDGTTENKSVPTLVQDLTNVKQVGASRENTVALLDNGTVKAWGGNSYGQLGDGTTVSKSVPTIVQNLTDVKQIAVGNGYIVVLLNDGTLKAWGNNSNGQLGDGTTVNKLVPTIVQNLTNVKQIAVGNAHTVALLNDGTVKAWGYNYSGTLGDGTKVQKNIPTTVQSLIDVKQIAAASNQSVALLNNGTLKTWGWNIFGQLGDGTTIDRLIPVLININDIDKTPPTIVYAQNGGSIPSLIVTATDIDGSISSLKYSWSTQNTVAPTSDWEDFASGGTISRQNVSGTEYLWINATDTANNVLVTKSNVFTPLEQVTVNKPLLTTGMTAKKWNGSSWDTVSSPDTDTSWYDYTSNKWANAQTLDGSMWVWIPRYEYKIPTPHSNIAQTILVNFLIDKQTTSTSEYKVHPAFTFGTTELTGIWVAKFEASGSITAVAVKPGATSLRSITISTMFIACRNMETLYGNLYGWGTTGTGIDTHLMKNTEWGAIAYLSNSRYGKNSEVWVNPTMYYKTGESGSKVSEGNTPYTYPYNNLVYGINASTTGNIYGVYDMSGGAYEYTASYIDNGNISLTNYGSSLVNAESKYKDLYTKGINDDKATNYAAAIGKYGDAVYETSNAGTTTTSGWYVDLISMPYAGGPFFIRGGAWSDSTSSGLFAVNWDNGNAYTNNGFRPVLVVSNEL